MSIHATGCRAVRSVPHTAHAHPHDPCDNLQLRVRVCPSKVWSCSYISDSNFGSCGLCLRQRLVQGHSRPHFFSFQSCWHIAHVAGCANMLIAARRLGCGLEHLCGPRRSGREQTECEGTSGGGGTEGPRGLRREQGALTFSICCRRRGRGDGGARQT